MFNKLLMGAMVHKMQSIRVLAWDIIAAQRGPDTDRYSAGTTAKRYATEPIRQWATREPFEMTYYANVSHMNPEELKDRIEALADYYPENVEPAKATTTTTSGRRRSRSWSLRAGIKGI
jgi:hypothetical protein